MLFRSVLDEATSALDAASEIHVLATLKHRLPHTIFVVVSHRPGVAAVADQCLGIDGDLLATVTAGAEPYCAIPQTHDRLV